MDLRGFGRRRTWLRELRFGRTDYLVLTVFAVLAVLLTVANIMGIPGGV
jgi:energy-coupling factor transport system permease protein